MRVQIDGNFSLPTQRCFLSREAVSVSAALFSAYAEVFLADWSFGVDTKDFSLPTQRCFQAEEMEKAAPELFSAYAEVFLSDPLPAPEFGPFLCLRRGVSLLIKVDAVLSVFSLPTQRCFRIADSLEGKPLLFSAYAEVFLA